ncbi:STM4504/CBY_0614 family protein [Pseudomonas iridis]|uniref:STM4504/CBY_0614 family protein n=1 Tax=Pseudomonas iridis TaxID=2710587 RepID=A0ABW8DDM8_9PSED
MAIIPLFSKRLKEQRGEVSDVYTYDELSPTFRVQLSYMIQELLGNPGSMTREAIDAYDSLVAILKREYGLLKLTDTYIQNSYQELHNFILTEPDVERCLDAIELCYLFGDTRTRNFLYMRNHDYDRRVDSCIKELNGRFKEAGCGYEYIDGELVRIDSQLLHSEAVKPAIHFLNVKGFDAPRDEFLGAFVHYRHGRFKEALVNAAKAFESTMKIICDLNGWLYAKTDTANKLITILADNGFIPSYHQSHLSALQSSLSSGIPTLRNQLASHGNSNIIEAPPEVVTYGLHLTASAIVLLASLQAKRSA